MAMALEKQQLERIAQFVKNRIGVALSQEKLQRMSRRILNLMQELGFEDFHSFYHAIRFKKDEKVIQALLNAVTVNETYFWREHEQFTLLTQTILPRLILSQKRIRILVAPSSSGEEVYSIMMAISEEKTLLEQAEFEIIGIDIDSAMIQTARQGVYGKRSIEKLPPSYLQSYFEPYQEGYFRIIPEFREAATFLTANIFDPDLPHKLGTFDIIFSRNMLIYFDMNDKRRCFDIFAKLLKIGGYLFLGHADANGIDKTLFKPLGLGSPIYRLQKAL